eukprot:6486134-Amphidinium_carterae.1
MHVNGNWHRAHFLVLDGSLSSRSVRTAGIRRVGPATWPPQVKRYRVNSDTYVVTVETCSMQKRNITHCRPNDMCTNVTCTI